MRYRRRIVTRQNPVDEPTQLILHALENEGSRFALKQAARRISSLAGQQESAARAVDQLYEELVTLQSGETAAVQRLLQPLCEALEVWPFAPPEPPAGPVGAERVN